MTDREKIIELINEIIRLRMKLTDPYFCPAYEDIGQDRPCDRFDECRRCHQKVMNVYWIAGDRNW